MFWDRKKDDDHYEDRHGARRRKLNPELQKILEKEDELVDHFYEGSYASPESVLHG